MHEHEAVEVEQLGRGPATPWFGALMDDDGHTASCLNLQVGSLPPLTTHGAARDI